TAGADHGPARCMSLCFVSGFASLGSSVSCAPLRGAHELSHIRQEIRAVHVSFGVDRDAFRQARSARVWVRTRIGNQVFHRSITRAADSDTAPGAEVEAVAGLGERQLPDVGPAVT